MTEYDVQVLFWVLGTIFVISGALLMLWLEQLKSNHKLRDKHINERIDEVKETSDNSMSMHGQHLAKFHAK